LSAEIERMVQAELDVRLKYAKDAALAAFVNALGI
jgi:hypothetical protein